MPAKKKVEGLPFCKYLPKPFTSLSRNKSGLIACSRSDGSIDIYDEKDNYYLIHHIPPSILASIYGLCWVKKRLFATGGEGRVFELDLSSIQPKSSLILHGGLVSRCIVAGKDFLICGNDGGFINFISVASGALELKSCLTKVRGKVLCLAVDTSTSQVIAVGDSFGKIHLLCLKTGSCISNYSIGNENSLKPVVVWSLAFVGGSLFSGDSRGVVSVWDVSIGSIVSSFKSHSADVLAIAVSTDNQSVFAAGVDPLICRFDLSQSEGQSQWHPSGVIRGCQRDVRGLAFVSYGEASNLRSFSGEIDHLLAVGNETRLQVLPCPRSDPGGKAPVAKRKLGQQTSARFSFPAPMYLPFWPLSVTPTLPLAVHYAVDTFLGQNGPPARLCLMQHADSLCLFRLPRRQIRGAANLTKPQYFLKLAHIQPKRGDHIMTACISSCGKYIAYADTVRSRILKVEQLDSWRFDPANPKPLVNLSRLGWAGEASYRGGGRHNRSRTSSATSSEADDSDEYNSSRLALDQSSADFFVTGDDDAKDFDYQLAETTGDVVGGGSNKRKASKATEEDEEVVADGVPPDQRDEASALPAARLMAFTPDSRALVTIESSTHQVTCRSLATGEEVWRFTPGTSDAGSATPVHLMKMIQLSPSSVESDASAITTVLALACLDGRVLVHSFSQHRVIHVFTCPKMAPFLLNQKQSSRPVSIALRSSAASENQPIVHLAVLYTTGQVTEWSIPLAQLQGEKEVGVAPKMDSWLEEFWRCHGEVWKRRMPRFHSLGYLDSGLEEAEMGKKLLLASRGFCLYIDRRQEVKPNDIVLAFRERNRKPTKHCLRINSKVKVSAMAAQSVLKPKGVTCCCNCCDPF